MASNEAFYLPLRDQLSQGDIVRDVPWGLIPRPVTICRPEDNSKQKGRGWYSPVADVDPSRRGGKAFSKAEPESIHANALAGLSMVLWHDCAIDKQLNQGGAESGKAFAAIAPVQLISTIQGDVAQRAVVDGEHFSFFPLEPIALEGEEIPACYVDLRYVWSVRQSLLTSRIASLSDMARADLMHHFFTFLTRLKLPSSGHCPTCGTIVQVSPIAASVGD